MVRQLPHFSATVRQSEGSALMVRLLPATAEESRGCDPEDTLRKTARPESVYLSTFWTYGLNDEGCYAGYCLFEAADRGKALRRTALHKSWPHHGDVIRPDIKKNFRLGSLPGKFKVSKKLPYYRVDSVSIVGTAR
jgi:hypothetical protein